MAVVMLITTNTVLDARSTDNVGIMAVTDSLFEGMKLLFQDVSVVAVDSID